MYIGGTRGSPWKGREKGRAGLNQSSFTANSCNGRVKGREKEGAKGDTLINRSDFWMTIFLSCSPL